MYNILLFFFIILIIFSAIAQSSVTKNFKKYSSVYSQSNIRACDLVRKILNSADLYDVQIIKVNGNLTDYYDPRKKIIALSEDVYNSSSIAALGVACHETGHALQYATHYAPIKIRNFIIPLCNISSKLLWPLVIIGMVFSAYLYPEAPYGEIMFYAGIIFYGLSFLFNLITLPVEYDASSRAGELLLETGALNESEIIGAKRVLHAAALTYVAALITSLYYLLRFIALFINRRR